MQLGWTAKDKITGFEGVIVGHARYLTGCDQFLLVPKNSEKDSKWFDEQRLDRVGDGLVVLDNSGGNGADQPAPMK